MPLSQMSDEELMAAAGLTGGGLSNMSDDELMKIAGISSSPGFMDKGGAFERKFDDVAAATAYGVTRAPLGAIQYGAEKLGFPETAEGAKQAAVNAEAVYNKAVERSPKMATIAGVVPQIGQVAALGTSAPAIVGGAAALGAASPELSNEDYNNYAPENMAKGETALTRTLEPVGAYVAKQLESAGVDPNSREGKAIISALFASGTLGATKTAGFGIGKTAQGINSGAKALVRKATKIDPKAVEALKDSGIDPTLQLAGDSWFTKSMSNSLSKVPIVGEKLNEAQLAAMNKLNTNMEQAASKLGAATDDIEGGAALQRGIGKFKAKTGKKIDKLYNEDLAKVLPKDTPARLDATQGFARSYLGKYADAPALQKELLDKGVRGKAVSVLKTPEVKFGTLKDLRSDIGEQAGKMDAPGALKQMYGSLSEDMTAAANKASPKAAQVMSRANSYFKGVQNRTEKLQRFFTQNKDGSYKLAPESVAKATRQELELLKRTVPKAEFDDYAASVTRNLGKANAGVQNAEGDVFSPNTFLTNFNKLGPKKDVIYGKEMLSQLERSAKIAERFKELNKASNTSNTTNNMLTFGSAALLLAPKAAIKYGGGAWVGAKLLTSPKTLKVINDYAYRPISKSPKVQNQFIGRMNQAAGEDPEMQRAVNIYLSGLAKIANKPVKPLGLPPVNKFIDESEFIQLPQKPVNAPWMNMIEKPAIGIGQSYQ